MPVTNGAGDGEVGPAPLRRWHFEKLDSFRGIAALLIVVHHFYLFSRGNDGRQIFSGSPLHLLLANLDVGVTWFFSLSGFVIFLPFARAIIDQRSSPAIGPFLLRRALRIAPLYYVVILVVWMRQSGEQPERYADLLAHLTFTHIFSPNYFYGMLDVAWSLGVEVCFYLCLAGVSPFLHRLCARPERARGRFTVLISALMTAWAMSVGYKWWAIGAVTAPGSRPDIFFGPAAQFDIFIVGALVAAARAYLGESFGFGGRGRLLLTSCGWLILCLALLLRHTGIVAWAYFGTVSGIAFGMLLALAVLKEPASRAGGPMQSLPLCSLGLISYSLYLWHRPLLDELARTPLRPERGAFLAQVIAFIFAALVVAAISYWAIERPVLRWRHRQKMHARPRQSPTLFARGQVAEWAMRKSQVDRG